MPPATLGSSDEAIIQVKVGHSHGHGHMGRRHTILDNEAVILPAYIDEAGARGLPRDLKPAHDQAISVTPSGVSQARSGAIFSPGG
jgi:hypothetical protein